MATGDELPANLYQAPPELVHELGSGLPWPLARMSDPEVYYRLFALVDDLGGGVLLYRTNSGGAMLELTTAGDQVTGVRFHELDDALDRWVAHGLVLEDKVREGVQLALVPGADVDREVLPALKRVVGISETGEEPCQEGGRRALSVTAWVRYFRSALVDLVVGGDGRLVRGELLEGRPAHDREDARRRYTGKLAPPGRAQLEPYAIRLARRRMPMPVSDFTNPHGLGPYFTRARDGSDGRRIYHGPDGFVLEATVRGDKVTRIVVVGAEAAAPPSAPAGPAAEALAAAHGFTLDALEENREGRLHPGQRATFEREIGSTLRTVKILFGMGAALILAFSVHGAWRAARLNADSPLDHSGVFYVSPFIGLFFASVPWTFAWAFRRDAQTLRSALARGRIAVGAGRLRRTKFRSKSGVSYYFDVPGAHVSVREAASGTPPEGTPVRIYSLEGDHSLLSLETTS